MGATQSSEEKVPMPENLRILAVTESRKVILWYGTVSDVPNRYTLFDPDDFKDFAFNKSLGSYPNTTIQYNEKNYNIMVVRIVGDDTQISEKMANVPGGVMVPFKWSDEYSGSDSITPLLKIVLQNQGVRNTLDEIFIDKSKSYDAKLDKYDDDDDVINA